MLPKFLAVFMAFSVVACKFVYRGDGQFVDHGTSAASKRYVLDMGQVRPGVTERGIGALPPDEFVIGFQISELSPESAQEAAATVVGSVQVSLFGESEEPVLHRSAPLGDWVWTCGTEGCSSAFAYIREDGGKTGTYFVPQVGKTYRIQVEIPAVDLFVTHEVRLVAFGGGWK